MTTDHQIEQPAEQPAPQTQNNAPAEEEIEIIADAPEAEQEEAPEQAKQFDPRTDKVDFSTPEQQEKFNYMYKQVKQSDARNQMLTDLLQTQQRQLDALTQRNTQEDSANAEHLLTNKIIAAREAGDPVAEINAIKELGDFVAEKKLSKVNKQEAPLSTAGDMRDAIYVQRLMLETGSDGKPTRPWLQETSPEFPNALTALETIATKYAGDPQVLQKSLAELDQYMSKKTPTPPPANHPHANSRAPNPMQGGNLTNQNPRGTIKMTRAELDIAKKLGVDPKKYAARRDALNKGGRK